jgi:hypothetical protein
VKLRTTARGLIAHDPDRGRWVPIPGEDDLVTFLPRSIRAYMLWEEHFVNSSRMLVKRFFPRPILSKSFATSIRPDVITPDALPDWTAATGRVRVDGEVWCEGRTAGPQHSLGEMLAYASAGERLDAGDVISTGTLTNTISRTALPV